MMRKIIESSARHPWMVCLVASAVAVSGAFNAMRLPLDAIPDLTNVQVQVVTSAGSLSPIEVERYITQPIELQLSGLPNSIETRSISRLGISLITVVFKEGTDLYWARQLISQRLDGASDDLPSHISRPQLGPLTTALGEVIQFEVRGGGFTPTQLRTMLEWDIAPRLKTVEGVTEVNSHGGYFKCYSIQPDPNRMLELNFTLEEIAQAVQRNNLAVSGGYMIAGGQQRYIQGESMLRSLDDIRNVVLRSADEGSPVLVRDVASVVEGALLRQGAASRDGRGEAVIGMAMMLVGENSRLVVQRVKDRLAEIQSTLPKGVEIEVIYDREGLIDRAIHTVAKNLLEGAILVVSVLFVFLGSIRAGLITAMAIPLSMLFATNAMWGLGISASLMSLGAIDFGMIVDSSVITIENCIHRLSEPMAHATGSAKAPEPMALATGDALGNISADGTIPAASADGSGEKIAVRKDRPQLIADAAYEVRKPTVFGELIIAVVFVPLLFLEGSEGKLFRPMALTLLLALGGSLVVSMTVMPALSTLFLPKNISADPSWLVRILLSIYRPTLKLAMRLPVWSMGLALAITVAAIPVAMRLGAEFMPRLEEGDLLIEALRLPSASLEGSQPMTKAIEKIVLGYPEVHTVFCKTGRPEIANDIMGVHQTDVWVILHPKDTWKNGMTREKLIEQLNEQLTASIPGVAFGFTQPIEMRVNELVAGVKSDVAALIYGEDIDELSRLSKEITTVIQSVRGAADVKPDSQANLTTLRVEIDHQAVGRYGLDATTIMQNIEAIGQIDVGVAYEGRVRHPIVIRMPDDWRDDVQRIRMMPIRTRSGKTILMQDVAKIELGNTPPAIEHEMGHRRTYVSANVRGRDTASFVAEAQKQVENQVKLPPGYEVRWGGTYENLQTASLRLALITPLVLMLVTVLIHATFQSWKLTAIIFLAIPVALSGGVFSLALRGLPFSISAGVGFIALLGIAVLNSLVWVSAAENMRALGLFDIETITLETAMTRMRPILMTASVAALGFLPMAVSHGDGAEIQRPLATVVIGGLITSTMLTTLILPLIYQRLGRRLT
ncbi:MAG: efflux RND transporter permease subunit [Planctomycetota bacterium]|nr:efflux RND transporter permease subunit [Planctomycetota bacterium]